MEFLPTPAQCAPPSLLTLQLLADLQAWTAKHPSLKATPTAAMALSTAMISPWRTLNELRWCARICVWTYALDDYTEQEAVTATQLDEMLTRCSTVVHTSTADVKHPLLKALSEIQEHLSRFPLYPALADLWTDRFDRCMQGLRYDWHTGQARAQGASQELSIADYLKHKDSVLVWITHMPRWISSADPYLPGHLDTLVPALDDFATAVRLANDLGTLSWEASLSGQNNVLMYGVTPGWVRRERDARVIAGRTRLSPLIAENNPAAIESVRLAEWAVAFYDLADFRDSQTAHPTPTEGATSG
ncbi:terpene synthase family protein [Streptomyces sp. NPDC051976]|uniref:terpene synthase family protein n=1 Tax=Streptomyces sp. NPDC051976 TaxID=3154947 RepID=UPI003446D305